MLYALANAGTKYDWSSWHTLVPLLVGFFIVVCFSLWESYGNVVLPKWSFEPVMPPRLFHHRTSLIVAINTFLHWMLVYWAIYFIPLWFQAVFLYSAETAGVDMLPMSLVAVPGSALAAAAVSRWGRFQWLHLVGEVIFTVCMGLFALQWVGTTTTEWASIQSVCALGGGIVLDTLLPAFQAPVPESDQAAATATWAFIRTVGGVGGLQSRRPSSTTVSTSSCIQYPTLSCGSSLQAAVGMLTPARTSSNLTLCPSAARYSTSIGKLLGWFS